VTDEEIEALDAPTTWSEVFDASVQAALRLTDAMCGESHALDEDLVVELRGHYDEIELAELILVAGQANLNNRAGNAAKHLLARDVERRDP